MLLGAFGQQVDDLASGIADPFDGSTIVAESKDFYPVKLSSLLCPFANFADTLEFAIADAR